MADKKASPPGMRVLIGLTTAVGTLWAVTILADIFVADYNPPDQLGVVFMAIVTGLLGMLAAAQRNGGKTDDKDEE